jgi:enoyl-CoA hydratase/carnithine racemase
MLFESRHIRVTVEYGTATLRLGFPGEPVNAFDLNRLREFASAIEAVAATQLVRVMVVRSALPGGFCAGLRPEAVASLLQPAERAAFSWYGQQVFDRLARLDAVTLAYIDGPCLGAGFELALACDHRICVARPTTHLGFPDGPACFGGSVRLRHLLGRQRSTAFPLGETLSGREARNLGVVDVACCERRGKIELRSFLDRLERRPVKRPRAELYGFAEERRAFAAFTPKDVDQLHTQEPGSASLLPLPPFPDVVGLLGHDTNAARLIAQRVLRGGSAIVCGNAGEVYSQLDIAVRRGFVTPLEVEQARARIHAGDCLTGFEQAGLVFVGKDAEPTPLADVIRPRTVVCVIRPMASLPIRLDVPFPAPRRVLRVSFCDSGRVALFPGPGTDSHTPTAIAAWLKPFGLGTVVFPPAARLLPQAA